MSERNFKRIMEAIAKRVFKGILEYMYCQRYFLTVSQIIFGQNSEIKTKGIYKKNCRKFLKKIHKKSWKMLPNYK